MNKNVRSVLLLIAAIVFIGVFIPKAEGYIREQLDDGFVGRRREGGPFHHESPEEGKPWSHGSGFILKGPLPPL